MKRIAVVVTFFSMLTACQFVPLTPGGEKARVLSAAEVAQCKRIGNTTTAVKADVVGIPRQETVISEELTRLARNNAAVMGGDTVVPASDVVGGTQLFQVYKCVPGP